MNKDFFKSSNPSRFHSLRDTRPEPTTWQVLFKEITNSTHTAATRHYRAHLATLSDIEATGDAQQLEQWKLTKSNLKNAQPAFIPSVLLEGGRTYAHVKGFTGFIMVDIDGIPPERFAAILTLVTGGYSFLFGVHHHLGMRHPGHQPRGGRSDQGQLPHGMGVGERPLRSPVRSGD